MEHAGNSVFHIFKIKLYCKYMKKIFLDKHFKKIILNRNHPLVFNLIDNYCIICNIKSQIHNYNKYTKCKHIFFLKK